MSERFIPQEENFQPHAGGVEERDFTISDGMELIDDKVGEIDVPKRMTGKQFRAFLGGVLPEGVSPNILDDDIIELEQ